jgi:branched-chain amino acid transport system ATP-binding protein
VTTAPILEIRNLSVSFDGLRAVDDVSFSIARNRITAVIGPNGAGKSTLFNLISGSLRPRGGQVLIEGIDYTGQPSYRMQAAGLARSFQITNLFFELSVAENLRLASQILELGSKAWKPVRASHTALARVDDLLHRFGLLDKAQYPVGKLSHGEQRRLEVAVAIACKPKLLLLDEPTQGMSHGDTAETAELIKSLVSDATILLIEHDIGLVMSLSDHVIVMHQGQKLAEGSPADIGSNPAVQVAYFGQA